MLQTSLVGGKRALLGGQNNTYFNMSTARRGHLFHYGNSSECPGKAVLKVWWCKQSEK